MIEYVWKRGLTMAKENKEKTIRINPAAVEKMKLEHKEGFVYRIEISTFNWRGPIYRLVQTENTADEDLVVTDHDLTIHAAADTLEFFEELKIDIAYMFGDENLVVKDRTV